MRWSSKTRDCVATFPRFRDEVIWLSLSFSVSVRTWNLIVNEIVFPWEITMEKARNWFSNFPHTQNKTRQGKPNETKQFTSNMKYELGAFVRELIEVLLPLLLLLHVTCEQLKLRKLRVGILDCLWVGYLLGSSFNSIWHSITCMADDSLNPPRDRCWVDWVVAMRIPCIEEHTLSEAWVSSSASVIGSNTQRLQDESERKIV